MFAVGQFINWKDIDHGHKHQEMDWTMTFFSMAIKDITETAKDPKSRNVAIKLAMSVYCTGLPSTYVSQNNVFQFISP